MVRIGTSFAVLALCVACQSPSQTVVDREETMSASGFKRVPATTPQQQLALKQLPAHKFSRQTRNGHIAYVYADPTVCVCLFVGNQNAYTAYKNTMRERKLIDERALEANDIAMGDDYWGPWGLSSMSPW
jgi:hypothetical protein